MTGKPVLIVVCLLYGLVETLCCSCDCTKHGGYYITQYYHLPKVPTSKLRPVIRQPQNLLNPIIEQSEYQLKPVMEQPEFDVKPMMKQPVFQLMPMPMMMTNPVMKQPETQPMTNENPSMDMSMSMEEVMKNLMENKPMDTPKLLDMMKKPEMKKEEVKNDEEEKKPVESAEKSLTDSISEDLDQFKPQPMEMKKEEMPVEEMPVKEPVKEMAEPKNDAVVSSMFEQTVGKDDKEGGSEKGEHHHDKNAYYKFEYAVNDKKTKDVKHQREVLKGDKIEGEYSLVEEDGNIRTVKYTADWKNGFRAVVHNSKKKTFPYN